MPSLKSFYFQTLGQLHSMIVIVTMHRHPFSNYSTQVMIKVLCAAPSGGLLKFPVSLTVAPAGMVAYLIHILILLYRPVGCSEGRYVACCPPSFADINDTNLSFIICI